MNLDIPYWYNDTLTGYKWDQVIVVDMVVHTSPIVKVSTFWLEANSKSLHTAERGSEMEGNDHCLQTLYG